MPELEAMGVERGASPLAARYGHLNADWRVITTAGIFARLPARGRGEGGAARRVRDDRHLPGLDGLGADIRVPAMLKPGDDNSGVAPGERRATSPWSGAISWLRERLGTEKTRMGAERRPLPVAGRAGGRGGVEDTAALIRHHPHP